MIKNIILFVKIAYFLRIENGVTKVSAKRFREKFNNKICKEGYRFYLKNFGYQEYSVYDFTIRLIKVKDLEGNLFILLFT